MLTKLSALEVSRRLKAARYLAGDIDPTTGKFEPLRVWELAKLEPIASSRLTEHWLETLEQMKIKKIWTQDLDLIAEALHLAEWWFDEVSPRNSEILRRLDRLEALIALKIPDAPPMDDPQEDAPSGGRKLSRAEQQWRRATEKLAPDEQTGPQDPEVPSSD